jgi:Uma2 family endonuclease
MYHRVDSGRSGTSGGLSVYRFSRDEMGNSHLQFEACRLLIGLLIDYFERTDPARLYRIGSELNFLLSPDDPKRKVVPDLYVMEDEPQAGPKLPSWKKWEHEDKVPTVAIEVVSDSYEKDYTPEEMPARYTELGVSELVRYDPDHAGHRRGRYERRLFGHFVRNEQGVLAEQEVEGEAVRLHTYPLWLVHRPPYHLRLATGDSTKELTLWPTAAERERARAREADERVRAAEERARSEAERAAAADERAAQAEAEVERLREELARLRGE